MMVCVCGSSLQRRRFNALFSLLGLALILWEVVVCDVYWALSWSLVAAFLFGSADDGPPAERLRLKRE